MIIELADLSPTAVYHLMTQTVVPRPIAWVLTTNADGESHNLAPYSYFNAVCSDPPMVMFSCAPKPDGEIKDTVKNILRGDDFVIHIVADSHMQAVQDTATPLPYGESELNAASLSLSQFNGTQLRRLADAPVAFACCLHHTESLGNAPQTLVFAEITTVYVDDAAITQQNQRTLIDPNKLSPLGRLGSNQFAALGEIIQPRRDIPTKQL